jgi:hypothetical protein
VSLFWTGFVPVSLQNALVVLFGVSEDSAVRLRPDMRLGCRGGESVPTFIRLEQKPQFQMTDKRPYRATQSQNESCGFSARFTEKVREVRERKLGGTVPGGEPPCAGFNARKTPEEVVSTAENVDEDILTVLGVSDHLAMIQTAKIAAHALPGV